MRYSIPLPLTSQPLFARLTDGVTIHIPINIQCNRFIVVLIESRYSQIMYVRRKNVSQTIIILLIVYTKTLFRCEQIDLNIQLQLATLKRHRIRIENHIAISRNN